MEFLIWSNDEQGWMRPKVNGLAGWTGMKSLAGKFTLEEAVEICKEGNLDIDFTPTKQDPTFIVIPNVTMFPDVEEYDDGQGRAYDILDEEIV